MNLNRTLYPCVTLGLCLAGSAWATLDAPTPINIQPLVADFSASNPGLEVAIPLIVSKDSNGGGYPESFVLKVNVYAVGTNTPILYSSGARTFLTPPVPAGCTPAGPRAFDFDETILPRRRAASLDDQATLVAESDRVHLALNIEVDCDDGTTNQRVARSHIYSADMSSGAGTVWTKSFADAIVGFSGIDTDDDLTLDTLAVAVRTEVANGVNVVMYWYNPSNGTATFPAKGYPAFR